MSRRTYFISRTFQSFFLMWMAITLLFFFFRLLPGDFTSLMVYQGASEESIMQVRESWGLDDPVYIQYIRYMENLLQLDAGTSVQFRTPVWDYIKFKILNSFVLIAPAITAGYIAGSVLGSLMGFDRGSRFENFGLVGLIFLGSFPSFFTAIFLVVVFSLWLGWFPTSGMVSAGHAFDAWWHVYFSKDFAMHYVLPFTAIFIRYLYLPALIMRTSIVEVMDEGFSYYYRMLGLDRMRRLRHLMRHASLPVITMYPISMTRAIGGLLLVEIVFNWPGIGFALFQGVLARDYPIVQFVFFLLAIFVIVANFTVDIVYGIIDPRISLGDD